MRCSLPIPANGFALLLLVAVSLATVSADNRRRPWRHGGSQNSEFAGNLRCCTRHVNIMSVGHAISGDEVRVDVGTCRSSCNDSDAFQRTNWDVLLREEPQMGAEKLYQKAHSEVACGSGYICDSQSVRVDRLHLPGGIKELEIVEECTCIRTPEACQRRSKPVRFFPGTPFEITMDTGLCEGPCGKNAENTCQSVRNKTVSTPGPNGDVIIDIIKSCACVGDCYRTSLYEQVYDFSSGRSNPLLKEIDVGQCVGHCGSQQSYKCILWDKSNPRRCLSGLYSKTTSCRPSRFKVHTYHTSTGERREIAAVADCGCL